MAQSHAQILLHIVFSTKSRRPSLSPAIQAELYPYMVTVLKNMDCPIIEIGGTSDHVHIHCRLSRRASVAQLVEGVKKPTSKWLKSKGVDYGKFQWQAGYGAFLVSHSLSSKLVEYIREQQSHHTKVSFKDELRRLFERHNIAYDEEYLWD